MSSYFYFYSYGAMVRAFYIWTSICIHQQVNLVVCDEEVVQSHANVLLPTVISIRPPCIIAGTLVEHSVGVSVASFYEGVN